MERHLWAVHRFVQRLPEGGPGCEQVGVLGQRRDDRHRRPGDHALLLVRALLTVGRRKEAGFGPERREGGPVFEHRCGKAVVYRRYEVAAWATR